MVDALIAIVSARLGEPIFTIALRDFRAIAVDAQPLDLVVDEGDITR